MTIARSPTRRSRPRRPRGGKGGAEPRPVIRAREARVWELACRGYSQREIALDVGLSQPAVSKTLQRVEARVFAEATGHLDRQKARQVGCLSGIYREAMAAWERSKGDATTKRQRRTDVQGGPRGASGRPATTTAELAVQARDGDPRLLEEARKTLTDLRELLGLNAPKAVTVHPGRPLEALTDEELTAALAEQHALAGAAPRRPHRRRPPTRRRRSA